PAPGPAAGPGPAPAPGTDDRARRRELRRMKALATGLLVGTALVYLVAQRWESSGGPGWVGFVRAAAEAGTVGALADWFAVTALFRRPMGLPIPHTAIIATRKDAIGASLASFVGTNFLSEQVVRSRFRSAHAARRIGEWLAHPGHAERVTAELARALAGALGSLRDEDVRSVLEPALLRRLAAWPVSPLLGRVLGTVVADGAHHRLVDLTAQHVHHWLLDNREQVTEVLARQAPGWSPRFLDQRVAARAYAELLRVAEEVAATPDHPLRGTLDQYLARLAVDLGSDPDTMARVEQVKATLLASSPVRRSLDAIWASIRDLAVEALGEPDSEVRRHVSATLAGFGRRLVTDPQARQRVESRAEDALVYLVTTYRDELTRTISDTVRRWDPAETSAKIELQVGRDLQFIRINGSIVGALAGLAIHTVAVLLR
ncbi:MAG: DUF445 domain-containing protein, partial [Actinomycetes bacterium]